MFIKVNLSKTIVLVNSAKIEQSLQIQGIYLSKYIIYIYNQLLNRQFRLLTMINDVNKNIFNRFHLFNNIYFIVFIKLHICVAILNYRNKKKTWRKLNLVWKRLK